mgnify:CR=1 FL=1
MNIHEYQAKELLKQYGAPVLGGGIAYTAKEAEQIAKDLGGPIWVVKAQIHAGGRGKGGGVRMRRPAEDISVSNVVRITESDMKIIECFVPLCPLAKKCKLRSVLNEARKAFLDALGNYTIADLIENEGELRDAGWL